MIGSLLGINILQPYFLTLIPISLAFLIFIYKKRKNSTPVIAPTLFILSKFKKIASARKKFFPPLRFFLEALMFFLLALLLSRISFDSKDKEVVIYVDDSINSAALIEGSTRRLDLLKIQAKESINSYRFNQSFLMIDAKNEIVRLTKNEASDYVDKLETLYLGENIKEGLSKVDRRDKEIYIFSGKYKSKNLQDLNIKGLPSIENLNLQNNIGITDYQIDRVDNELKVTLIKNFIEKKLNCNGSISLSDTKNLILEKRLENIVDKEKEFEVGFKLHDFAQADSARSLKVTLQLDKVCNSLETDDTAWILASNKDRTVRLHSDLKAADLKLDNLSGYNILNGDSNALADIEIFHRREMKTLSSVPSLYILPEANQGSDAIALYQKFLSKESNGFLPIVSWDINSPILQYLTVPTLKIKTANIYKGSTLFDTVVNSELGPIVLKTENNKARQIIVGFELLPYEGKESITLSLLLLNSLKWLTENNYNSQALKTYDKVQGDIKYIASDSKNIESFSQNDLPVPGIIKNLKEDKLASVNFFSGLESQLKIEDLDASSIKNNASHDASKDKENLGETFDLKRIILIVLISLFLLDLLLFGCRIL